MKKRTAETPRRGGLWRRLALTLLGLLLGMGLFQLNALRLGGDPLPMPFGIGISVVLSGSMEPALQVNDLVLIRATEACVPGDIVVWQSGRSMTIHRVVRVEGDSVITRGDANNTEDAPVPRGALRGKMVYRIPRFGMAVRALRTPLGVLALLVAALLLIELPLWRERAQDAARLDEIREEIRRLQVMQAGGKGPVPENGEGDRDETET